jgi:hypothetical protein
MSVNYKVYFWSQSLENAQDIVQFLNDQKNEEKYGELDIEELKDFPENLSLTVDGYNCIEFWRDIQENLYSITKQQWLTVVFCDYDWSYQVKGNLEEGLFQKNIFMSKAPKLIDEIESGESILKVIMNKMVNKKIKVKSIDKFKSFSEWN